MPDLSPGTEFRPQCSSPPPPDSQRRRLSRRAARSTSTGPPELRPSSADNRCSYPLLPGLQTPPLRRLASVTVCFLIRSLARVLGVPLSKSTSITSEYSPEHPRSVPQTATPPPPARASHRTPRPVHRSPYPAGSQIRLKQAFSCHENQPPRSASLGHSPLRHTATDPVAQ